jgi:hypothetical protein
MDLKKAVCSIFAYRAADLRVVEAAQQLHAISTSQAQRQAHDLEARFSSAPFS